MYILAGRELDDAPSFTSTNGSAVSVDRFDKQPAPPVCKPEPGEVAASHTAAGILTKDVESTDKGVLVTDFGIERRSVKAGAKRELASLIHRLETKRIKREVEFFQALSKNLAWAPPNVGKAIEDYTAWKAIDHVLAARVRTAEELESFGEPEKHGRGEVVK